MGAAPSQRLEGRIPPGWLPMAHVEALLRTEGVRLAALCDVNEETLRAEGARYGVRDLYTDYRRLLEEVRPQILTIATRTPPKPEILQAACGSGVRGIYIEKPLANSIEDCRRSLSAAAMAGVRLAYGVNRRYHSAYLKALDLVLQGAIGELVEISIDHGRAQLLWSHPHSMDLILQFSASAELRGMSASLDPGTVERRSPTLIDSDPIVLSAFFQFANGVTARIGTSGGLNVRLGGTRGNLTVHADGSFLELHRAGTGSPDYFSQTERLDPPPGPSATITAMTRLVRSVVAHDPPPLPPGQIENGMRMLLGCAWSHLNGGKTIALDDIPGELCVTGKWKDRFA